MKTHEQYMAEATAAITRIREVVALYGLTAEDLGLKEPKAAAAAAPAKKATKRKRVVRYRDGNGHDWDGRGHQPRWITDSGKSRESFRV
jgi:DNA-binding protein H-NS